MAEKRPLAGTRWTLWIDDNPKQLAGDVRPSVIFEQIKERMLLVDDNKTEFMVSIKRTKP